jgi:hypothetical protein
MTHLVVFYALLGLCTGYALLFGGAPERIVALLFLGATALMPFVLSVQARYTSLEAGALMVDAVMYVALLWLALRAERFWPIWMSAMQGVQLLGHGIGLLDSKLLNLSYAIIDHTICYPMMLLLMIGVQRHRARLVKTGADASWSTSSIRWSRFTLPA